MSDVEFKKNSKQKMNASSSIASGVNLSNTCQVFSAPSRPASPLPLRHASCESSLLSDTEKINAEAG